MKIIAQAKVQITVEVSLTQPWSADESVTQIYKRASTEAVEKIQIALKDNPASTKFFIIGTPKVFGIITEQV